MEAHERLRRFRMELGITQRELAKILGISPPTYNEYEKGRLNTVKIAWRLKEYLGINDHWLLEGTEPKIIDPKKLPMNLNIYTGRDSQNSQITVNDAAAPYRSEIERLRSEIELLKQMLINKDQQIADLRKFIEHLTSK